MAGLVWLLRRRCDGFHRSTAPKVGGTLRSRKHPWNRFAGWRQYPGLTRGVKAFAELQIEVYRRSSRVFQIKWRFFSKVSLILNGFTWCSRVFSNCCIPCQTDSSHPNYYRQTHSGNESVVKTDYPRSVPLTGADDSGLSPSITGRSASLPIIPRFQSTVWVFW